MLSQLSYTPEETFTKKMVGLGGFEPPTSRLSGVRSNQLSYRPPTRPKLIQWLGYDLQEKKAHADTFVGNALKNKTLKCHKTEGVEQLGEDKIEGCDRGKAQGEKKIIERLTRRSASA